MEVEVFHITRVPSPSLKYDMDVYMAILFGGEAWGPEVQGHWRSIRAISAVDGMEVGTYHITRVPSLKYDMDAYMATLTFWRRGLGLVLRGGLSKKLDPTLGTSSANSFA